jgi:probable phosphoglycerate mutase
MINLVIARHGETVENGLNICQGQTDGTLSEKGKKDNEQLGIRLKQFAFQTIYTSTLNRAFETAGTIQLHNPIAIIKTDNRLVERNLGVLQGNPYPVPYIETDLYEGMETIKSIKERLHSFLSDIKSKHSGETVVLVSHGFVIKVLLTILRSIPTEDFHTIRLMSNSCYIEEMIHDDCNESVKNQ